MVDVDYKIKNIPFTHTHTYSHDQIQNNVSNNMKTQINIFMPVTLTPQFQCFV